jgi:hypothetical protein
MRRYLPKESERFPYKIILRTESRHFENFHEWKLWTHDNCDNFRYTWKIIVNTSNKDFFYNWTFYFEEIKDAIHFKMRWQ